MKITTAEFITSGTNPSHFPAYHHPEFAFLGRSNVGKSSLMNMVMGRKNLVKTGAKPGVTITINFFLANGEVSLVDLPGYGYARLPEAVRKSLFPMIADYVKNRKNLKLVFLLVDIRRTPDESEEKIINLCLEAGIPVALVITKADKIPRSQTQKRKKEIIAAIGVPEESCIMTSTLSGAGKNEIHAAMNVMRLA